MIAWISIPLLFGLCFFSIFKKSILLNLAIIVVVLGMIFSEAFGEWIDLSLALVGVWAMINIIKGVAS